MNYEEKSDHQKIEAGKFAADTFLELTDRGNYPVNESVRKPFSNNGIQAGKYTVELAEKFAPETVKNVSNITADGVSDLAKKAKQLAPFVAPALVSVGTPLVAGGAIVAGVWGVCKLLED